MPRYKIRTLLILLAIGPPMLAGAYACWWAIRPVETSPPLLFSLQAGPIHLVPWRTGGSPQAASLGRPKFITYDPSLAGLNGQMILVQEKQEKPYGRWNEGRAEQAVIEAWKRQGMWPIYFTDGSKLKD